MENAYALSTSEVLKNLGVDQNNGLSEEQVTKLRAKHGKNGKFGIHVRAEVLRRTQLTNFST